MSDVLTKEQVAEYKTDARLGGFGSPGAMTLADAAVIELCDSHELLLAQLTEAQGEIARLKAEVAEIDINILGNGPDDNGICGRCNQTIGGGYVEIRGQRYHPSPCAECAWQSLAQDAESLLATARADLATAEQENKRLEQTIGTYVTAYKEMTRQRNQAEQEKAGLEAEVKHWQTCSNCGETMDAPGHCFKATLEATEGWMAEVKKERQAREALQARIEKAKPYIQHRRSCDAVAPRTREADCTCGLDSFLTDAPDGGQG